MKDQEMLELAAKAIGISTENVLRDKGVFIHKGREWNPLTDNGDALELAVKLRLFLIACRKTCLAGRHSDDLLLERKWKIDPDECAAMRRAIVRAAANVKPKGGPQP